MFAIAVKPMPGGTAAQAATSALLNLTHMLAIQELLKAKSLLDHYAGEGLTDATTLREAVVMASGKLSVSGRANGVTHQAAVQDGFAVGYVLANEKDLTAHLLQPAELAKVKASYREVMHRQARELMGRSNWRDAILLWRHLHTRKLTSPELYLDAARCFKELNQDEDLVRLLDEAIDQYGDGASAEFLEEVGDLAMSTSTAGGQQLAERAYVAASERLRETVTQPSNEPEE